MKAVLKLLRKFLSVYFLHIPSSFCEDLSELFLFVFTPNKKLIYLLRNMERNAWSTEIGPGKDTPNGPRNDIFH